MSSGNLIADRRYAYALSLRAEGDFAAAADILAQAMELVPAWAEGQFALAEALADAGQAQAAAAAFRAYLTLDPKDSMNAGARLVLLGEGPTPADLPAAYVTRLFDGYASYFETSVVEKLKYRGPALLRDAVTRTAPGRFGRVFDLGCGTGLGGAAFRDLADWLGGVDLSPGMVKKAAAKGIYDHLEVGDMRAGLANLTTPCDLIVAADVLIYLGDLTPILTQARPLCSMFALTLQRAEVGTYSLGRELRYSHSFDYFETCARLAGFRAAVMEDVAVRQEAGKDVPGILGILV